MFPILAVSLHLRLYKKKNFFGKKATKSLNFLNTVLFNKTFFTFKFAERSLCLSANKNFRNGVKISIKF